MNLIGHYACAAVPSPEVRVGSVLPDLASLYRRKVRALAVARQLRQAPPGGPEQEALLAGVEFHHAVDADFHRAPLFLRGAGAIQATLLEASRAPGLKRFLPAHVLCELYLDHLLLRREPALAEGFYRDIRDTQALLTAFMARHPLADAASFNAFLTGLVDGRFVDGYLSIEGILGRMQRMLVRLGQRPLLACEQEAVTAWFVQAAPETERALTAFVEEAQRGVPRPASVSGAPAWRAEPPHATGVAALSPAVA
jgi:hypothetical protein